MSYITTANQYITVGGNQIAYRELSKGKSEMPLVMLVHLAAVLDNWDPKLLDLIAQEIVRLEGNLVNRLILAGTGPRGGVEMDKVTGKTFRFMFKGALHRVDPKRYIFYNHDEQGGVEAAKVLSRMGMRKKEDSDKEMNVPGFLTQLKAIKRWGKDAQDSLEFITQPTLIVNGDNDLQVPTANSYEMHEKIAGSKLIIYPNAGHGSIFQYAEEFSTELLAFLAE